MLLSAFSRSMRPWPPETCHMPFKMRQMVRSGASAKRSSEAMALRACPYAFTVVSLTSSLRVQVHHAPHLAFLAVGDVERAVGRLGDAVGAGDRVTRVHQRVLA